MDGGHYVTLSRPRELAERLHAYAANADGGEGLRLACDPVAGRRVGW